MLMVEMTPYDFHLTKFVLTLSHHLSLLVNL